MSASIAVVCVVSILGGAITMLLPKATAGYRFQAGLTKTEPDVEAGATSDIS